MNRFEQQDEDLIDLGTVTAETKGGLIEGSDSIGPRQAVMGLTDD